MRRVAGEVNEVLNTAPEDALAAEALGLGRYILAATFGNVHGIHKAGPDESGALGTGLPVRGQARSVTCWPPTDSRRDRSSAAATSSTIWSWARARTAVSTNRYLRSGTRGLLRLRIDRHTNETMTGAIDRQRRRLARLTGQAGRSTASGSGNPGGADRVVVIRRSDIPRSVHRRGWQGAAAGPPGKRSSTSPPTS